MERVAGTGVYGDTGDGGPALQATFQSAAGLAIGNDGTIWVSDLEACRVRRISPDGVITAVAGISNVCGVGRDNYPAPASTLGWPMGIGLTPDGSLYVTEFGDGRVR